MEPVGPAGGAKKSRAPRPAKAVAKAAATRAPLPRAHAAVLEETRRAGLLDGDRSEHVSFRAPPALVEAAKREAGVASTTEIGMLALAMLAQRDPVVAFLKRTRGRLGKDHSHEY